MTLALRVAWGVIAAVLYWVLFTALSVTGLVGVPLAVLLKRERDFPIYGNRQEGLDPPWYQALHPTRPHWLRAFVFGAWRNKLRNLPFALPWLHTPPTDWTFSRSIALGAVTVVVIWNGWMTELQWENQSRRWFGDIGPRLDQAATLEQVSWAFRLFGRY